MMATEQWTIRFQEENDIEIYFLSFSIFINNNNCFPNDQFRDDGDGIIYKIRFQYDEDDDVIL